MNTVDFTTFKIRASAMPAIMSVKEELTETAKDSLMDYWLETVWDRKAPDLKTKYTEKGIACESDALDLLHKTTGNQYFKNKKMFENEWVKGTPDVDDTVLEMIKDIKCSWSMKTFLKVDQKKAEKDYGSQMQTYMWIKGYKKAQIIYALVNTPEEIIADEAYRASFNHPELNTSEEAMAQFRKNYIFDDVPDEKRVKIFEVNFDPTFPDKAQKKVFYAREYLSSLSL